MAEIPTSITTDKELKEAGATMKVGLSQLKNKTPNFIAQISNGIIFACMAWALLSPSITEIPAPLQADITRWLMVGSGFIKLASKFFGLELPKVEA